MSEPFYIPEFDTPFSFVRRPSALPADLRPIWRISILLLMLLICCKGGKSSLQRLYVLNWAVRSPEGRADLLQVLSGQLQPADVIVRYEPGLDRAIDFALGENLVERVGGDRIQLTDKGKSLARTLVQEQECLSIEKKFFEAVKHHVSEARIKQIVYTVSR